MGLGAGGHSKVVIEILRLTGDYEIMGLLDAKEALWNTRVLEVPVLGGDDLLRDLYRQGLRHAFIGVGSVGDARPRQRLYGWGLEQGFRMVQAIHPGAVVSPSADIGAGVTIMAGALINAEAHLGDNVIVNTGAIVEHDCVLGDHSHLATGAVLSGSVRIGPVAHVGAGATVRQGITIGEGAVVGAGAVVVKDVPPWTVVVGVPASPLRDRLPVDAATSPLKRGA